VKVKLHIFLSSTLDGGESRDSSVGIATGYGPDDRRSRVRFPAGAGNFSLHHRVQNGSGVRPAGSSPGSKATGREADHSPPSSAGVKECVVLYLHSPTTPSWRGAQLKCRENFTFTFYILVNIQNSQHRYAAGCILSHSEVFADSRGGRSDVITTSKQISRTVLIGRLWHCNLITRVFSVFSTDQ
jgi:hypothetical protein